MKLQLVAGCALLLATDCAHSTQTGKAEVKDAAKVTAKTPPGHPPLAASPAELMEPGSQRKVAQALKGKGLVQSEEVKGEQLSSAIRKFQKSEGLAETGFPDDETLNRLGIDPKEVDKTLENFSGSRSGEARADGGKESSGPGKGGSGEPPSENAASSHRRNDTPPTDAAGKDGG